jgi:hypothetical protein
MSSPLTASMVDTGGALIPEMSDPRRTPRRRPRPPWPYSCTNARPPAPGRPRARPSSIAATRPRDLEEFVAGGTAAGGISTSVFERSGPPPWCPTWPLPSPIAARPRRSPAAAAAGGAPTPPGTRRAADVVSGPAAPGGDRPDSRWICSGERPTKDDAGTAPTPACSKGAAFVRPRRGRSGSPDPTGRSPASQRRSEDAGAVARPSADAHMGRRHAVRPRSPASSITGSQADISIGGRPVRDDKAAARPAPRSSCKTRSGEPGSDRDKPLRHEVQSARPPPSSRTRVPAIKPLAMIVPAETRAGHLKAVSAGRSAL